MLRGEFERFHVTGDSTTTSKLRWSASPLEVEQYLESRAPSAPGPDACLPAPLRSLGRSSASTALWNGSSASKNQGRHHQAPVTLPPLMREVCLDGSATTHSHLANRGS